MIVIDGSMGEGGGQILRTSIALSALTLKPIKIINIRAKRSNPGLRPQHLIAIKAVASLCNAKVEGLNVGSREVTFMPHEHVGGNFKFDIGTAGSISLVLQAVLTVAAFLPEKSRFIIRGGTDVPWSPPIDYVKNVLIPTLKTLGFQVELKVLRRGHYPRGGGIVEVTTIPVDVLRSINVVSRGRILEIKGLSHAVRLPRHVAERQAKAAFEHLRRLGIKESIHIDTEYYDPSRDPHLGPGSGIVLWAPTSENTVIGADALGARGKPAEVVGKEAAEKLFSELSTNMAFDSHIGDMLIPYIAVAKGASRIGVSKLTLHAITNILVTEKILNVKFHIEGEKDKPSVISVKGLGLSFS